MSAVDQQRDLVDKFQEFYRRYYDDRASGRNRLYEFAQSDRESFVIDFDDLYQYDPNLAEDLVDKRPEEFLGYAREALQTYDLPVDGEFDDAEVAIGGLSSFPDDLYFDVGEYGVEEQNKLITVRGQVNKVAQSKGDLREITYKCLRCGTPHTVPQQAGSNRQEPHECHGCERQGPFEIDWDASEAVDYQLVRVQRPPEKSVGGAESDSIDISLQDDMVGAVSPGDRVDIATRLEPEADSADATTFTFNGTANHIEHLETDYEDLDLVAYEDQIRDIAESPNPLQRIIDSIKPSHLGDENIKQAIALQMFGGVKKELPDGSIKRGNSHVLLVGDPGTNKSGLLEYAKELSPRSVYTSGKNATSAGLTCAAVQSDFGEGGWTLEAGALVQAHKGLCAIDEFDKMDDEDRSGVQEALSQGTISPSKAGITNVTMPAETTVLAAANPKYGRFDKYEPIGEQVELDPTLISRFDLIFIVKDDPDPDTDAQLAEHLNEAALVGEKRAAGKDVSDTSSVSPAIDPEVMRHYIAYAKQNITPELSEEAREQFKQFYVEMRAKGADEDSPVPITARKLEALHRLGEAMARMRLSETVTGRDASRVIELVRECLNDVGIDPETGEFDADVVETGSSKTQRERMKAVLETINELAMEHEDGAPRDRVTELLVEDGYTTSTIRGTIDELMEVGEVYEPRDDHLRTS